MLFLTLFLAAAEPLSETEIWNQGVDYYNAGDVTNTLATLRPLMVSREYGARAAEVVAKLEYAQGDLEEAAAASQLALLKNPKGGKEQRNFARATQNLETYRNNKHIEEVMAQNQGDPSSLTTSATLEARDLFTQAGTYRTNDAERAVALCDNLSERAYALGDKWIPIKAAIAQASEQNPEAQHFIDDAERASEQTLTAAQQLADFSGEAYGNLSNVEHAFTRFEKLLILPPAAIREDLNTQSNAWQDVEKFNGRDWQQDALDFTRAFRAKFPSWAKAYDEAAQADTNKPPFTAEAQAKISALATEIEKLQMDLVGKVDPTLQESALEKIREVIDLMPPEQGNGGGAGAPQGQPQGGDNEPNPSNDDEQNKEQEQQAQQSEESKENKETEALLKSAEDRNNEHEDEKKRGEKFALPPNERDW